MTSSNALPVIHALWVGGKLGDISRCCLKSFVMRGHEVHLHVYDDIEDVPDGITLVDGNEIIPRKNIIKHKKTGSYALFSDVFRYQLLKQRSGVYVDCDVYCLKPVHIPESGYLFGFEEDARINGAVLALPRDSKLLDSLLNAAYDPFFIPPWYKKSRQRRLRLKKLLGIGKNIADMPWGVIGPDAITYFVNEHQLLSEVKPIDVFYPVHYRCIQYLLDRDLQIDDVVTGRTVAVHLYNEMLKGLNLKSLGVDCILQKFLDNKL